MASETASIGLKNLIPALRLMDNYKIIESKQVVDEVTTGCFSCPYFSHCLEHTIPQCNMCTKKVYRIIDTPKYINEKNRFGEKKSLKRNALLLLLYLHFLHPDNYGLITLHVKDAAALIGCEERTIRNNMELLNKHHYICLQKGLFPGTYRAFIQSYSDYFLPANQGGRGYITISYNTLKTLANETNLNSIRLSLRVLVSSVDSSIPGLLHKEHTLFSLRQLLPTYCCNKLLKAAFSTESFKKIFEVSQTAYTIYLDIKETHHPGKLVSQIKQDCKLQVENYIKELNNNATKLGYRVGKHWFPTKEDISDIASIALQYDTKHIIRAIQQIYNDFVLQNRKIDKLGALVRTLAHTNSQYTSIEA